MAIRAIEWEITVKNSSSDPSDTSESIFISVYISFDN